MLRAASGQLCRLPAINLFTGLVHDSESVLFTILKRDDNGELTEVAQADTREAAEKLMARMKKLFSADQYELREVSANDASRAP